MQKTQKVDIKANPPEKKYRAGAVCATVWKNHSAKDGKDIEYRTVSFERNFQNEKGEWNTSNSLRVNDLPKAVLVLQKAYEYVSLKDNNVEEEFIL